MKLAYLPEFGHAFCPHCRNDFNLEEALPTFIEKAPHNDTLVYVMCPDCHASFQRGENSVRKAMSDACFVNVKLHGVAKGGGRIPFAITSTLALALNDWCITSAIENGHGLTESEYFSICSRQYQVMALPGGLHIISSCVSPDEQR
jgi:hypothetical protein